MTAFNVWIKIPAPDPEWEEYAYLVNGNHYVKIWKSDYIDGWQCVIFKDGVRHRKAPIMADHLSEAKIAAEKLVKVSDEQR